MNLADAKIITAMVTPFNDDLTVNFDAVPGLVNHLIETGSEAILVAGTTGESPTLTHDEEIELFQVVKKAAGGRVPLIAGIGTNDTRDSVNFIREVDALGGFCCGLAVVPYYNKPNQEGMYQHFKAISEASNLPIMLYNVPGRTVASISVDTILRLAELPNVVAVKECTGLDDLTRLVEQAPNDFLVYTGEDGLAFAGYAVGIHGVISVASHLYGREIKEMFTDLDNGKVREAAAIQRKLLPKMNALFSVPSPAPVKMALNEMGLVVGELRLPLVSCTVEEKEKILSILNE